MILSGITSTALIASVVAVGATVGSLVVSEDPVDPMPVFHRDLPGPAQIELTDINTVSASPHVAEDAPPAFALFGVDLTTAVSDTCADATTPGAHQIPDDIVCAFTNSVMKTAASANDRFGELWLNHTGVRVHGPWSARTASPPLGSAGRLA